MKLLIICLFLLSCTIKHTPIEPKDVGAGIDSDYTGIVRIEITGSINSMLMMNNSYANSNVTTNYVWIRFQGDDYDVMNHIVTITDTNYTPHFCKIEVPETSKFNIWLFLDKNNNSNWDGGDVSVYNQNNISYSDGDFQTNVNFEITKNNILLE